MASQVPKWMQELYDCSWVASEAFTEERHGLTVVTSFSPAVLDRIVVVRQEYLQLWDHLREAHEGKRRGGLVLTGHPGTGKSSFLRYAFTRAMHEKIPVAYCTSPDGYFYCDENGCARYPLAGPMTLHHMGEGKFFLALVDSSFTPVTPPVTFLDRYQRCYTVQETPLDPARWHGLAKEREAEFWILPFWTEDEVRKLQQCYEDDGPHPWTDRDGYYSPLDVFHLLGPSVRQCFFEGGNRKTPLGPAIDFQRHLDPDAFLDNLDAVITAVHRSMDAASPEHPDLYRLLFAYKRHDLTNPIRYPVLCYNIPTLHLSRVLLATFRQRTDDEQVALIAKLAKLPQVMSFVYEPIILDVLSSPDVPAAVACHLADGSTFTLGPGLVLAGDQVTAGASIVPRDNHIYFLRNGLPWLSAVVISEDQTRVTILHTTVAYRRKVVSSAVSAVIKLLRRSMPNTSLAVTKWTLIFVSPGASGEQMAKKMVKVKFRNREQHPAVAAGWLEIGAHLSESYPEKVLDELKRRDAVHLDEVVDDDPEPDMDEDPPA
ncbi:hypothetical protein LXA43DRAFT_1039867 [Ganoderma leucocontextum]|nr:hypothetical protein LXA43DRAFT_1039867 [Ganoderma leucocontextum]